MGRWAAASRFVKLFLNGRYRGVYVLMERPELGEDRIDVAGQGLTGDYLLEFTFPYQARRKGPHFRTPVKRRPIVYEDPERGDLSRREASYIRGYVARTERALYSGRRGAWRRVLDPGAAVDYVLVQELFRNVDAFHGSTYLTKPAGGKLVLGPVWDFDLSSGNSTYGKSRGIAGWWTARRDWASAVASRSHLPQRAARPLAGAARGRAAPADPGGGRSQRRGAPARGAAELRPLARAEPPGLAESGGRGSFTAEVRFLRSWLSRRMNWIDRVVAREEQTMTRGDTMTRTWALPGIVIAALGSLRPTGAGPERDGGAGDHGHGRSRRAARNQRRGLDPGPRQGRHARRRRGRRRARRRHRR